VRSIEVVYIGMGAARNTTRYSMLISNLYNILTRYAVQMYSI
jgi:hypothetical protein